MEQQEYGGKGTQKRQHLEGLTPEEVRVNNTEMFSNE